MSKYKKGDKAVVEIMVEYQMEFLDLLACVGGIRFGDSGYD